MFGRFGVWEVVLILVIVVMVFGAGKLPQVGDALGRALRSFRKGRSADRED